MNRKRMERRLLNAVFKSHLEMAVAEGRLDPSAMTESQIVEEIEKFIEDVSKGEVRFDAIIDHAPALLKKARSFARRGQEEDAILYYATWIEHSLNRWVVNWVGGYEEKDQVRILIRETELRAKYIWISKILTGRPPSSAQLGKIFKIAELRNRYVHYKWKPKDIDDKLEEVEYGRAIEDAERIVAAFSKFERIHFYKKSKKKIGEAVRKAQC